MTAIRLHNWHSSSTSFRVRIALNLKGLAYENVPVELRWQDGDHERPEFRELNPQANVPLLEIGNERIQQSLAIIDYLDRTLPDPALFPADALGRARVWSLALHVACEIQPMNNLRVQRYLMNELKVAKEASSPWQRHWIAVGFDALERQLANARETGTYCHGNTPTAADLCLVPQVFNAKRPVVGLDIAARWPTIDRIFNTCMQHPAFEAAQPKNQPGYEPPSGH